MSVVKNGTQLIVIFLRDPMQDGVSLDILMGQRLAENLGKVIQKYQCPSMQETDCLWEVGPLGIMESGNCDYSMSNHHEVKRCIIIDTLTSNEESVSRLISTTRTSFHTISHYFTLFHIKSLYQSYSFILFHTISQIDRHFRNFNFFSYHFTVISYCFIRHFILFHNFCRTSCTPSG